MESNFFAETVRRDLLRTRINCEPVNSLYEGFALLHQDFGTFWEQLRQGGHNDGKVFKALVQLGVTAQRVAEDCGLSFCEPEELPREAVKRPPE